MDARLVRAYLDALPDLPPDGKALGRVRFALSTLQGPDVRYLVAALVGPGAGEIARVTAAVLHAAGAPTSIFGPSLDAATCDGAPIDDVLLGRAGTLAAAAGYQLADAGVQLGEPTRRDATVILALTAFAEANQRVVLLVDEPVRADDPIHAPRPDLVVIADVDGDAADRAMTLIPDGRPAVVTALPDAIRVRIEERAQATGTPLLLGGRDHRVEQQGGRCVFSVRDEPYVGFDELPDVSAERLATGIATALALGVMGIRMREDWVVDGIAALRAAPVVS